MKLFCGIIVLFFATNTVAIDESEKVLHHMIVSNALQKEVKSFL